MIVEDDGAEADAKAAVTFPTNVAFRQLLLACANEASYQAGQMAMLDAAVGDALRTGALSGRVDALQSLDLLRQESLALSRLLNLLCGLEPDDAAVGHEAIVACLPTAAQRSRLAR